MKTILLTGPPGVGKTTIIQRVLKQLPGRAEGFYTAEIRDGGRRTGFKIVTLDGQEGVLAHVDIAGPPRVGKYGVDVASLEAVGIAALERAITGADIVVIDEIGKMEMASPAFMQAVERAIESRATVLGTVLLRPHPWVDRIKRRPDVIVWRVSRENRDGMAERVLELLRDTT